MSPLCLGCMGLTLVGSRSIEAESIAIVDHALAEGINFLDTANVYGRGMSEQVVGKALNRNGKRHRVVLATKVHGRMDDEDPNSQGNHRRHIIEQCEASLKRLQTDWIDLYQIHRPSSQVPIDETLRALDDLVRTGKVRYLGTSTFAAWQVVESLWASRELGLNRFISEQPPYHLLDRRIERELVAVAQSYGLALIPWSPLAGGLLSGKYKRGRKPPEGARHQGDPAERNGLFSDASFDVVERVESIAKDKGCSPSQLSLAWNMHQPGITSPIIGPRTMEQLTDNLGALKVSVTDDDRRQLDEVAPPGEMIVPFYEGNWGPHQFALR